MRLGPWQQRGARHLPETVGHGRRQTDQLLLDLVQTEMHPDAFAISEGSSDARAMQQSHLILRCCL
jgi:hypothetical protein